ncbi:MAG: hypothetical protein IKB66_03190 [Clostridia bacterium]|nr:hypothetical protein [Clostridia bacterium]
MLENDNNIKMNEITVNTLEERKQKAKIPLKFGDKDVWDYVILEVGIACGIMLVLLAVNCIGAFSSLGLASVNALLPNVGTII